jgi:hypothetical protein
MLSIRGEHRFCSANSFWTVPWQSQGTKKTGKTVDGTGNPAFNADIRILGDRIAAIEII